MRKRTSRVPHVPGKCGAKKKQGPGKNGSPTCTNPAGFKTDHFGVGRCWLHGGKTPVKHGLYSSVVSEQNREMVEQLAKAPDLSSLDKEIALMRVIIHEFAERAQQAMQAFPANDPERLKTEMGRMNATCEQISQLSMVIQRKSAIDTAQAVKLTPTLILQFVQIVESIVARYLTRSEDFAAFGRDLRTALPLVGAGGPVGATSD